MKIVDKIKVVPYKITFVMGFVLVFAGSMLSAAKIIGAIVAFLGCVLVSIAAEKRYFGANK